MLRRDADHSQRQLQYNKPKRLAPHTAMLDACTVLFVGANALAVGLISSRVLEIIGMRVFHWYTPQQSYATTTLSIMLQAMR